MDPTLKGSFFKDKNWTQGSIDAVQEKTQQVFTNYAISPVEMSPEKVPTQECSTSLVAQLYKKRKLDERSEFDRYMRSN